MLYPNMMANIGYAFKMQKSTLDPALGFEAFNSPLLKYQAIEDDDRPSSLAECLDKDGNIKVT